MNRTAEKLLALAAVVDGWPDPPRPGQALNVLAELDLIALQMSGLVTPYEPPQCLHHCARALYTMTTHAAPDVDSATAVVRVATRCIAAAHRALCRLKEQADERTND